MAPLLDEEEELTPSETETTEVTEGQDLTPDPGGAIFDDPGQATDADEI